jgi:hypothetical protein
MPLEYGTTQPLTIDTYDENGLAAIVVQGGRYGGTWVITATANDGRAVGELRTSLDEQRHPDLVDDPRYPYLAIESAFIWLREQTEHQGLGLAYFECLNHHYPPGDAPYFCAARAVVAGPEFVPTPGVEYADGWTLDQAMMVRS